MSKDKRTTLFVAGAAFVAIAALSFWWFNRGYPPVSDNAYQYATAMISICNREDETRLKILADKITAAESSGELSAQESRMLLKIVRTAERGNWQKSESDVRRLMADQTTRE